MNFQKLFAPLTRSREDRFFNEIIGHGHIKRLFALALRSDEPTHTPRRGAGLSQDNISYVIATTFEAFDYLFKSCISDISVILGCCALILEITVFTKNDLA